MPSKLAREIAKRCEDAYSADAYRSWSAVAQFLLNLGYSERETEAIMRSKHTRWARDRASSYPYGKYPAHILGAELKDIGLPGSEAVQKLVSRTFDD